MLWSVIPKGILMWSGRDVGWCLELRHFSLIDEMVGGCSGYRSIEKLDEDEFQLKFCSSFPIEKQTFYHQHSTFVQENLNPSLTKHCTHDHGSKSSHKQTLHNRIAGIHTHFIVLFHIFQLNFHHVRTMHVLLRSRQPRVESANT